MHGFGCLVCQLISVKIFGAKKNIFQRTVCVHLLWHCEYASDILLVTLPSQASWKIHFFSYLIITKFLFSVLVNPCKECSFWRYSNKQMLIKQISYPLVSVKTVLGNIFCSPKKIHFLWDSPDFSQLGQQCHFDNNEVWIIWYIFILCIFACKEKCISINQRVESELHCKNMYEL